MSLVATLAVVALAAAAPPPPVVNRPLTPDEVAMLFGTLVVAEESCQIKINRDAHMGTAVARLGQNIADFMPGAKYASLVVLKVDKAEEWIATRGRDGACHDFEKTLQQFLPSLF